MKFRNAVFALTLLSITMSCSKDNENTDNNTPSAKTSLPVKVIYKIPNGTTTKTTTYSYDSQNRLKTVKVVDANASLNFTETISYENGKITSLRDYDNPAKEIEKHIFFYDEKGIKNEEFYRDNILNFRYEWYYRPDGGKERRVKYTSGVLFQTWYLGGGASVGYIKLKDMPELDGINESEADKGTLSYGIDAVAGLEYKFSKLPIAVSADWQPGYALNSGGGFGSKGGGFGVRYTF